MVSFILIGKTRLWRWHLKWYKLVKKKNLYFIFIFREKMQSWKLHQKLGARINLCHWQRIVIIYFFPKYIPDSIVIGTEHCSNIHRFYVKLVCLFPLAVALLCFGKEILAILHIDFIFIFLPLCLLLKKWGWGED